MQNYIYLYIGFIVKFKKIQTKSVYEGKSVMVHWSRPLENVISAAFTLPNGVKLVQLHPRHWPLRAYLQHLGLPPSESLAGEVQQVPLHLQRGRNQHNYSEFCYVSVPAAHLLVQRF